MKKTYSVIIPLLVIGMFLGMLAGCAADKNASGTEDIPQGQQTVLHDNLTTAPEQSEPGDTQPDAVNPTDPDPTQPEETDPVATQPVTEPDVTDPATAPDSTNPPTEPEDPTEPEVTQPPSGTGVTYLEYYAMSADEQQLFIDSFGSLDAFFAWHTAAKEEYESGRTPIDGGTLNP